MVIQAPNTAIAMPAEQQSEPRIAVSKSQANNRLKNPASQQPEAWTSGVRTQRSLPEALATLAGSQLAPLAQCSGRRNPTLLRSAIKQNVLFPDFTMTGYGPNPTDV